MNSKNKFNNEIKKQTNSQSHIDDLIISSIPANEYEGTKKLAYTWVMPVGYSEDLLWTILCSRPLIHELQKICTTLAKVNPEIKKIIEKDTKDIYTYRNIIGGVSSKFSPEDINYYTAIKGGSRENDNNLDVQNIIKPYLQSITIDYNAIQNSIKEIYNNLILGAGNQERVILLANKGSLSYDEHTAFVLYLEHIKTQKSLVQIFEDKPVLLFKFLKKIWGEKHNCKIQRCISPYTFFTKCYSI